MADTMYQTGNPVPSANPKDRWDNSIALDGVMESVADTVKSRTGKNLYTVAYFNRIVLNAQSQVAGIVSTVQTAANGAISDILGIAADTQAEMEQMAAALGSDLNVKHSSTAAGLPAQTKDGVVAIVDADPDPEKNGWWAWKQSTATWSRLVQQPAWETKVNAHFYRTENMVTGSGDSVIDSTGGTLYQSLEPNNTEAMVVLNGLDESLVIDTKNNLMKFGFKTVKSVDILDAKESYVDRTECPDFQALALNESAQMLVDPYGGMALNIDTVNRVISSEYQVEFGAEQRPPIVFVDKGPRLERNTNDPRYRLSGRVYQATATIERTGKNRYWSAWRADNKVAAEAPGNFTVLAYSDDDCNTFPEYGYFTFTDAPTEEQEDAYTENPFMPLNGDDKHSVDPMLWQAPNGELWMFFGVFGNNKHFDGVGGCWAVICRNPNAKFPVWGQPFRLSYFADPRRPINVNGKWYIAIDGWRFSAELPPIYMGHVGPHIYEIDYINQKLKHVSQLPPNNGAQYSGFFETEFIQRGDGVVMATCRWTAGDSGVLVSFSRDMMKTWSPWVNYTELAPAASSRTWLGRTPTGRMLYCWNNDTNRGTLTVGLSDDEGETYAHRVVLEPPATGQVTYPIVTFGDDGAIFVIYDNQRTSGRRQIRVAKVVEQEIVAGSPTVSVRIISDPANP